MSGFCKGKTALDTASCQNINTKFDCNSKKNWVGANICQWKGLERQNLNQGVQCASKVDLDKAICNPIENKSECISKKSWTGQTACTWLDDPKTQFKYSSIQDRKDAKRKQNLQKKGKVVLYDKNDKLGRKVEFLVGDYNFSNLLQMIPKKPKFEMSSISVPKGLYMIFFRKDKLRSSILYMDKDINNIDITVIYKLTNNKGVMSMKVTDNKNYVRNIKSYHDILLDMKTNLEQERNCKPTLKGYKLSEKNINKILNLCNNKTTSVKCLSAKYKGKDAVCNWGTRDCKPTALGYDIANSKGVPKSTLDSFCSDFNKSSTECNLSQWDGNNNVCAWKEKFFDKEELQCVEVKKEESDKNVFVAAKLTRDDGVLCGGWGKQEPQWYTKIEECEGQRKNKDLMDKGVRFTKDNCTGWCLNVKNDLKRGTIGKKLKCVKIDKDDFGRNTYISAKLIKDGAYCGGYKTEQNENKCHTYFNKKECNLRKDDNNVMNDGLSLTKESCTGWCEKAREKLQNQDDELLKIDEYKKQVLQIIKSSKLFKGNCANYKSSEKCSRYKNCSWLGDKCENVNTMTNGWCDVKPNLADIISPKDKDICKVIHDKTQCVKDHNCSWFSKMDSGWCEINPDSKDKSYFKRADCNMSKNSDSCNKKKPDCRWVSFGTSSSLGWQCSADKQCESNKCKVNCCDKTVDENCIKCYDRESNNPGKCSVCKEGYRVFGGKCIIHEKTDGEKCYLDNQCTLGDGNGNGTNSKNCKTNCCKSTVTNCKKCNEKGECIESEKTKCTKPKVCRCEGGTDFGGYCKKWDEDGTWCYLEGGLDAKNCEGATKSSTYDKYWSKTPCINESSSKCLPRKGVTEKYDKLCREQLNKATCLSIDPWTSLENSEQDKLKRLVHKAEDTDGGKDGVSKQCKWTDKCEQKPNDKSCYNNIDMFPDDGVLSKDLDFNKLDKNLDGKIDKNEFNARETFVGNKLFEPFTNRKNKTNNKFNNINNNNIIEPFANDKNYNNKYKEHFFF